MINTFLGKKKVVDWKTQQIIKLKCCGRKKLKRWKKVIADFGSSIF
jgi:hypothetical protein